MPDIENKQTDSFGNVVSGIQLGGNVLSSALAVPFQLQQNRLNRNFAREMASKQYERQVELWNMQNEYNSPAAQMQRLVDAGLNPYMAQGSGGLGNGLGAPSVPSADGAFSNGLLQQFPDVSTPIRNQLLSAQIRNLNAKTDNETRLTDAKVKEIFGDTPVSKAKVSYLIASAASSAATAAKTMLDVENYDVYLNSMKEETRKTFLENEFSEKTLQNRVDMVQAELDVKQEEAKRIADTITATIANLRSQTGLNNALARKAESDIKLNDKDMEVKDAMVSYYKACANHQDASAAYVRVQKAIEKAYGPAIKAGQILNMTQLEVFDNGVKSYINKVSDRRAIEKAYAPDFSE